MQRDEDDDAWRAIIENYGERAELDDDPARDPSHEQAPEQASESPRASTLDPEVDPPPAPYVAARPGPDDVWHPDHPDAFVAPDPPLPPKPTRDRQLAWVGLIGSPIVLLVFLVTSMRIPSLLAYALIAGFVGGFVYLVFHLPRTKDDPFDDGARV